ncbi:hypothetical protein NOR51B_49 [Luminiphilus syltensis NOR5-1B]|uniref:Uncharacterized protein n=1 Tax=Luminiphilus syltensis NOR5-1B TaxID=565045 RepID=B8KU61_9GAMM|nr:hypothetical protein [Luminiphilus syltensis]EED34112.1 hypothetical protein NOR51B_49 [Luminiphilus syltensis NOR5-1B]
MAELMAASSLKHRKWPLPYPWDEHRSSAAVDRLAGASTRGPPGTPVPIEPGEQLKLLE